MKKRILFVALTVLMLITAFLTVSASANSIGDVDGDGSITAADARLALRASVKLETLTDAQTKAADVDGQPGITAADARLILRASVKLEELKDPHTHSFTGKVTKAATCTAEGVKTFTCECGEDTYTEKIPATGHSYDKGVVTLPTCTAEGYTTYTCSSCKHSYNADTVKANGHTEVKDKAVAATCTKTGLTEGKHCSVCGTVFTAQSVVPATGHNMKETAKAVAATCTVNGKTAVFTCANNCGKTEGGDTVSATGHNMKETAKAVEPTCTVNGKTAVLTCANNCGKTEGGETVYAEGHKFSTTVNATEATCATNGNEAYKSCTVCNKFFAASADNMSTDAKANADAFATPKNKNNHADLKTVTAKTPTCTEDGYKAYEYCTKCDYTTYEKDEAKGHSFSAITEAKAATCIATGNKAYKSCTVCNKFFAAAEDKMSENAKDSADAFTTAIDSTNHAAVLTQVEAQAPTCTEDGYKAYEYCTECDYTTYEKDEAKGHSFSAITEAKAATCIATGNEAYKSCTVCNKFFAAAEDKMSENTKENADAFTTPKNKNNHADLKTVTAKTPTCTEDGYKAYEYCTECDYTTYEKDEAKGHSFSAITEAKAATCIATGNKAYKSCTVCNKFFAAAEDKMSENAKDSADAFTTAIDSTNHAAVLTQVEAQAPTCTEDGYKAYEYCTECDYTTYEKDEAKGHSFSATVNATDATCATNGNEAYKSCTVCNKFFAANADKMSTDAKANADAFATPKNKNNHADLKTVTAKTPTCTEDGYKAYEYCTKCDYTTYEKDEAKGHSFSAITEAKAATCIATGNKAYKSCTVCNKFFAADEDKMSENAKDSADAFTTAIDSTNHAAVLTQVEAQAPTCTEIGWYAYEYCSECDYTTYEEIPELGHSTTEEGDKEPTCTEPGYCTRCETELPAIATGHDLVSKTVNHTCFDDGYTVDICTRCDYYENLQTPDNLKAPGHHSFDEENIKVVAATCTTQGYKEKTCTASYWLENEEGVLELMPCGVKEKFDIVDELGHSLLWETNEEASCTKTGLKTGTCTRDNCNYTTTEIIPLKAHSPSATAITVPGEGDTYCKLVIECTVCHTALQEDSTQGHRIEFEYDYVADDEICTTDATGTKRCMVCNYVEENVLIAKATGHEGNISDYTPATCTKDGYAVIGHCTTCNKEINGGFVIPATGHTTSGIATCTTDVRCMICNEVVEEKLGHNFKVRALAYNTDIDQFFCTRCGVATEDTLDTFNALANSIKGTYFRDHFNNPKNGSNRIELIRFSKTTANTTYSRFDFGIYTNTIKDLYDDEMAKNTDNYSPVRTTGILRNTLPLTNTGVVSLLEAGDIDASNGIKAEKLNSLNVRDVLSAYSDTYTVGEKNYDISSYKKVINEEVIKVTVNVKNEKYSQIKNLPDNQSTALEKVFDLNIRDDVKEFKDVNGRLILEEQDKGDGYEITMSMELLEIESDATVTYYFAADTYEPILAVYNAKIIMDQTIDMNFKIGLFSLNGEIDPVITTNYSYAYLFPNFFA